MGLAFALFSGSVSAQEITVEEDSPLRLEALRIEPAHPEPGTLCRLYVTLQNSGKKIASLFEFTVKVEERTLETYEKELFFAPLRPGESQEIRLFNFWTRSDGSKSQRPRQVEVALRGGRWVELETMEGGEEIWQTLDPISGLPSTLSVVLDPPQPAQGEP